MAKRPRDLPRRVFGVSGFHPRPDALFERGDDLVGYAGVNGVNVLLSSVFDIVLFLPRFLVTRA
jgi:hypothetical protein